MKELKSLIKEGRRLWLINRKKEAKKLFQKASRIASVNRLENEAHFFETVVRHIEDRTDEALENYLKIATKKSFQLKGDAFFFAGLAYFDKKEYDKAIECYQKTLKEEAYDSPGNTWNNMGLAYLYKKQYDRAIECYQRVLRGKTYDTPGNAWGNMGNAYLYKEEYDKAIECYQKALREKTCDSPGRAWNHMGNACLYKKEYDKAIECYQKALKEKTYDSPGKAWNNMGLAYLYKNEHEKAIECYQRMLKEETYDSPGTAWYNMGLTYSQQKEYDKAIGYFQKARSWAKDKNIESLFSDSELQISLTSKRKSKITESDIRKEVSEFLQEKKILMDELEYGSGPEGEIAKVFDKFDTVAAQYSEKAESGLDNIFVVLKGWSSSIPGFSHTFPESFRDTECLGGGYFLKWKGKGIVIDPGTHFLKNFTSLNSTQPYVLDGRGTPNFHIKEVDAVLTTHNHPDHTYDLPILADQINRYNQQVEPDKQKDILYLLDEDTYIAHRDKLKGSHTPGNTPQYLPPKPIEKDLRERLGLKLTVFLTKHDKSLPHSIGLVMTLFEDELEKYRIGITSDTTYMPELPGIFDGCNVVVCHFSSLRLEEFQGRGQSPTRLGYAGTQKIIQRTNAQIFIVTEFWGGKGDIRFPVVKKLAIEKNEDKKIVLGGDIGMMLKVPDGLIRCSRCGSWIVSDKIKIPRPAREYETLRYLCPNCIY